LFTKQTKLPQIKHLNAFSEIKKVATNKYFKSTFSEIKEVATKGASLATSQALLARGALSEPLWQLFL
jgi:hypothetical protein